MKAEIQLLQDTWNAAGENSGVPETVRGALKVLLEAMQPSKVTCTCL